MAIPENIEYTIFGSKGFIGDQLKHALRRKGKIVYCPERDEIPDRKIRLGRVIYCIGLTADFRSYPFETVDAHIIKLMTILSSCSFESFVYLSSARVYLYSKSTREDQDLKINPSRSDDLYNLSKLTGESICLSLNNPFIKIVRLSNVLGPDLNSTNFIFDLIKSAICTNKIELKSDLNSSKDYIHIDDVVELIVKISNKSEYTIYNLASGINLSHGQILNEISKNIFFTLEINKNAKIYKFPEINVDRIKNEFNFTPKDISPYIELLIRTIKTNIS